MNDFVEEIIQWLIEIVLDFNSRTNTNDGEVEPVINESPNWTCTIYTLA